LPAWGYDHHSVCHGRGEYAREDDGDGYHEVHVNTMEGVWSLLRSWLRPHWGISQESLPVYLFLRGRAKAMGYPSDLTETEWELIQHHFLPRDRRGRAPVNPRKLIVDAIW
jgi:hypothetical protein